MTKELSDCQMQTHEASEAEQVLIHVLHTTPPPAWILEMIAHYQKTGAYRARDLRRLLGDPCEGVRISPDTNTECVFSQ
jgi:hypothetical protein